MRNTFLSIFFLRSKSVSVEASSSTPSITERYGRSVHRTRAPSTFHFLAFERDNVIHHSIHHWGFPVTTPDRFLHLFSYLFLIFSFVVWVCVCVCTLYISHNVQILLDWCVPRYLMSCTYNPPVDLHLKASPGVNHDSSPSVSTLYINYIYKLFMGWKDLKGSRKPLEGHSSMTSRMKGKNLKRLVEGMTKTFLP
ncbi:Uncharacterized protein APZ42_032172 [Daphnia magna]|uniref:Uncharacterized protein n=1 Tax=Daphnia magna TaxID=35525 RepID=A0A164M6W1_9CRUS|nr:Uncharacterized protein APZ42_032172 [Daphnia magna]